jgi:hypothetical protein
MLPRVRTDAVRRKASRRGSISTSDNKGCFTQIEGSPYCVGDSAPRARTGLILISSWLETAVRQGRASAFKLLRDITFIQVEGYTPVARPGSHSVHHLHHVRECNKHYYYFIQLGQLIMTLLGAFAKTVSHSERPPGPQARHRRWILVV